MAASRALPAMFRKLVVTKVTTKFREAVELVTCPLPNPGAGQLLVQNKYVGINASDINFTAKRYDPKQNPPFDCGFEGVGQVVSVGSDCKRFKIGQPVAYMQYGAFAEYIVVNEKSALPLPNLTVEYLPLIISGLTAAIGLDKVGEITAKDTVLVTAAAGGTGQFAVQWAKHIGCHVIGTCSSEDKVQFLRSIGCDRPINVSSENLDSVLKSEYPKGVDVVYETIGGDTFNVCLKNLATKGKIIVVGFITGYETTGKSPIKTSTGDIMMMLLARTQSIRGFMVFTFVDIFPQYWMNLTQLLNDGKLKSSVDLGERSPGGAFRGIESIADAVEYLYTRKNIGKVVVQIDAANSKL